MNPLKLWSVSAAKFGYIYSSIKFHKDSRRFIAGLSKCSTTLLSSVLSDVLLFILNTLRRKDNLSIRSTGIRRFFVVSGYEEVADFCRSWDFSHSVRRSLDSADFATAYTSTPLDDLKQKVKLVLEEAWTFVSEEKQVPLGRLKVHWTGKKSCSWSSARKTHHSSSLHTFSLYLLVSLVEFLIDNIYALNGGILRRQTIGIPMGTNCAPAVFNLYLYYYESTWIDSLINTAQKELAKEFHLTFRLIDDVFAVDSPDFLTLSSCYPDFLTLESTTLPDKTVNFLGMHLSFSLGGQLCIEVYDKRKIFLLKLFVILLL